MPGSMEGSIVPPGWAPFPHTRPPGPIISPGKP
jgi:hypothetical protein